MINQKKHSVYKAFLCTKIWSFFSTLKPLSLLTCRDFCIYMKLHSDRYGMAKK